MLINLNANNKRRKKSKNKTLSNSKTQGNIIKFTSQSNNQNDIEKVKKIMEYKDREINSLRYEFAIQFDNRTYCEYYISLIKTKHNLIFTFFYNIDYNVKIIKMDLFFIGFALHYTINCLFFDDNTKHHIHEHEGSFDLEYQLTKITYSFFVAIFLNGFLKYLSLSDDDIIKFKQNKSKRDIGERKNDLENKLRIRFILFFILSFLFLLFFWYYIAMFGAIYKKTQLHLLNDTLISFGLSLIYPFIINLFPGIFRIPALSDSKKKRKYLYDFSKILQKF